MKRARKSSHSEGTVWTVVGWGNIQMSLFSCSEIKCLSSFTSPRKKNLSSSQSSTMMNSVSELIKKVKLVPYLPLPLCPVSSPFHASEYDRVISQSFCAKCHLPICRHHSLSYHCN